MTDTILVHHLLSAHPGAHFPWYERSGYIHKMSPDALERLHLFLVAQGEDCKGDANQPVRPNRADRLRRLDASKVSDRAAMLERENNFLRRVSRGSGAA